MVPQLQPRPLPVPLPEIDSALYACAHYTLIAYKTSSSYGEIMLLRTPPQQVALQEVPPIVVSSLSMIRHWQFCPRAYAQCYLKVFA